MVNYHTALYISTGRILKTQYRLREDLDQSCIMFVTVHFGSRHFARIYYLYVYAGFVRLNNASKETIGIPLVHFFSVLLLNKMNYTSNDEKDTVNNQPVI